MITIKYESTLSVAWITLVQCASQPGEGEPFLVQAHVAGLGTDLRAAGRAGIVFPGADRFGRRGLGAEEGSGTRVGRILKSPDSLPLLRIDRARQPWDVRDAGRDRSGDTLSESEGQAEKHDRWKDSPHDVSPLLPVGSDGRFGRRRRMAVTRHAGTGRPVSTIDRLDRAPCGSFRRRDGGAVDGWRRPDSSGVAVRLKTLPRRSPASDAGVMVVECDDHEVRIAAQRCVDH